MKFRVVERNGSLPSSPRRSTAVLLRDHWDDFGFKTLFQVEWIGPDGESTDLGTVKILKLGQVEGPTQFDSKSFLSLSDQYCSLGQDIEYYEKLAELPSATRIEYLRGLRDAAFDPDVASRFHDEEGWSTSLLRFGAAEHALTAAPTALKLAAQTAAPTQYRHQSNVLGTSIEFNFASSEDLPARCEVLIGYNGVGKTRLLAEMASDISKVGLKAPDARRRERTFAAVVAISYSAFDDFELPYSDSSMSDQATAEERSSTSRFGYTYCGLRRVQSGVASSDLKSLAEINQEVAEAFRSARKRRREALADALSELQQDPSFGRAGLRLSEWVRRSEIPSDQVQFLSSGQKIALNIVVQLAAHLRQQALVLIDEPETHLHPPLLAALLRAIQRLLEAADSYAVIATHSPIVLQEIPARDVQVIERFGEQIQVVRPRIETFGAGLGELTHEVFGLDNTVADYRQVLRELAVRLDEAGIERLFPLGLSTQARALVSQTRNRLR